MKYLIIYLQEIVYSYLYIPTELLVARAVFANYQHQPGSWVCAGTVSAQTMGNKSCFEQH